MVAQQVIDNTEVLQPRAGQSGPPTIERVLQLKGDYEKHYRQFYKACRDEEDFYFGRNEIPVPDNMAIDTVRPATAFAIINIATDHVDVNNPTIYVPPPSPRAMNRSERIQKFLQGFWMHIPEHVKRTGVRQAIGYGKTFLKVVWKPEEWPDAPKMNGNEQDYKNELKDYMEEKRISFPFGLQNVNPQNLIWDDSRSGMKWAIEVYETTGDRAKEIYPQWVLNSKVSHVTYMEYWDEEWSGRILDNQWVWGPYRHGYGDIPYVEVTPGQSLNWDIGKPEQRFRGILKPVHNLLNAEARLVTQYEAILRQYAWRTLDFHGSQIAADNTRSTYELFGSKNIVLPGVTVAASPIATPPQEILTQLTLVQTMIEEATFPNVIRGIRPRGISSGFGVSVLAGMGRLVFGSYADGMARAMEQVNQRILKLVENKAAGRVTVRARGDVHRFDQSIGADDIQGFYENTVVLKAESPEEREREAILAERLYKSGLISLTEAQRRAGITNPLEEQNLMAAERLTRQLQDTFGMQQAAANLNLPGQLGAAADAGPENRGNEFSPGLGQLPRPGEANLQKARVASQAGQPSVFPQGIGGLDILGKQLSTPGGKVGQPSGGTV